MVAVLLRAHHGDHADPDKPAAALGLQDRPGEQSGKQRRGAWRGKHRRQERRTLLPGPDFLHVGGAIGRQLAHILMRAGHEEERRWLADALHPE